MLPDYRVILHNDNDADIYAVHEVHYDGQGSPTRCSVDPVAPVGMTADDLTKTLIHYVSALTKPVIPYAVFQADPSPAETTNTALNMFRSK
jgi:hypothetical protein